MSTKRPKPPMLSLKPATFQSNVAVEPVLIRNDDDDDDDAIIHNIDLALSPHDLTLPDDGEQDDLARALADLAKLRESVQNNLRLRPIRSFSRLPKSLPPERSPSSTSSSVYYTPDDTRFPIDKSNRFDRSMSPPPSLLATVAWDPSILHNRLSASRAPILIDTRPLAAFQASHFLDSTNISIPSLILKRCRKPAGGFQSLAALRQFITSDTGKHRWDIQLAQDAPWDGDIVLIHGEETNESEKDNLQVTPWALLPVLSSLLGPGRVHYLRGGIAAARSHPLLETHIVKSESPSFALDEPEPSLKSAKTRGLSQLNTSVPTQTHFEIDQPMPSPLPVMPSNASDLYSDLNRSSAPSHLSFRRPAPPRRPSVPNLTRIVTNGDESHLAPPRLKIRTTPTRSATLPITPSQQSASWNGSTLYLPPQSPSHLNLIHSNHTLPASSPRWTASPAEFLPPPSPMLSRSTPPRTPEIPLEDKNYPPSPSTARPGGSQTTPTEEEEFPPFTVSMILPNFLYLGPELTLPEHVEELKSLGIKRILNIAAECDDNHGLDLRENFERYVKIPMRDTVEEDKITEGLKEACDVLDEASLFGASTYVHCKAGKSRSVTAVMAYLIHANHWTLSRAYAFVLERRKGISPNIGFVSELMTFEERELGGKSVGVVPKTPGQGDGAGDYVYAAQNRRPGHARESLPPMLSTQELDDVGEVAMGQDLEIKDTEGRYRHMRRAPVDENTLYPFVAYYTLLANRIFEQRDLLKEVKLCARHK